jgi:NDP-sugar pyrophosphorylase family protein
MNVNEFVSDNVIPELEHYPFLMESENVVNALINVRRIVRDLRFSKSKDVHTSSRSKVHESANIINSYLGNNVTVYEGCTVRDSIILDNTVVGHGSEIARSIVLRSCEIPGFNYIASSLLGERVWIGGHVSLASRRHDNRNVFVKFDSYCYDTGQWKFGSLIGSDARIGYCSHINPGCVIGKGSFIGPHIDVKIYVPPQSMINLKQNLRISRKRKIPNIRKTCYKESSRDEP